MGNKEENKLDINYSLRIMYFDLEIVTNGLKELNSIGDKLLNKEYDTAINKAEKLYKRQSYQLKYSNLKGVFSENEISHFLSENNNIQNIIEKVNKILKKLDELQKKVNKWMILSNIVKISYKLVNESRKIKKSQRTHAQLQALKNAELYRKEFMEIKQMMNDILKLLGPIVNLAPPVIEAFLNFYFDVFQKADKICNIVNTYTENILRETQNIGKFQEIINDENTLLSRRRKMLAELKASGIR